MALIQVFCCQQWCFRSEPWQWHRSKPWSQCNSKTCFYLLLIGLNNDAGHPIIDINQHQWDMTKPKISIKPKIATFIVSSPICNNTKIESIAMTYKLKSRYFMKLDPTIPKTKSERHLFIYGEVNGMNKMILTSILEPWIGNVPHLQLVQAIFEDDIKGIYLCCNEILTWFELDALKSKMNSLTDIYEMIADYLNSTDYIPTTKCLDVHSSFLTTIDCSYKFILRISPVTPQKLKNKISCMQKDCSEL